MHMILLREPRVTHQPSALKRCRVVAVIVKVADYAFGSTALRAVTLVPARLAWRGGQAVTPSTGLVDTGHGSGPMWIATPSS
jgi:hypothetical protein